MCRRLLPLLLLAVLVAGCRRTPPAPKVKVDPPKAPVDAEKTRQGLSRAERSEFHHQSMGSELVPLAWLKALESQATGKPFLDNVERFGLVADPDNADGLPIGLTAAVSKDSRFGGKMVGLNCAVCHTGEMTYKGKTVRIEGGSSLFDAEAFTKDLLTSLVVTMKSPAKLVPFIKRQLDDKAHAEQVAAERPAARLFFGKLAGLEALHAAGDLEKALAARIDSVVKEEFDRPSANLEHGLEFDKDKLKGNGLVGKIEHGDLADLLSKEAGPGGPLAHLKTKLERETGIKEMLDHIVISVRMLKARVDFAKKAIAEGKLKLANTSGGPGRVDDFGAARNLLFEVKDAQAMTAPCSIPHLWGTHQLKWSNWDGSTQSTMERSLATALAGGAVFDPKTYRSTVPVRNLGQLEALAKKITPPVWPEDVFGKVDKDKAARGGKLYKEHCSRCHVLSFDNDGPPDILVDLKEIGTDPNRVYNYAVKLGEREFGKAVEEETGKYMDQACKDDKVSDDELKKFRDGHNNVWRITGKYAARPLVAVWATPPYLHNGSVPTIYHLLLPASERPATFNVGHRDYDPDKLGYLAEMKGSFVFDTKISGNRNTGHEYGTKLTDAERYDLIEYLKAN